MAADPGLKAAIELELLKNGRYAIAASPISAEMVLIAEGVYTAMAAWGSTEVTGGLLMFGQDWEASFLGAILSIAVPGPAFRQHRGDVSALFTARSWEGASLQRLDSTLKSGRRLLAAKPEEIARRFHTNERPPKRHPSLCPASLNAFDLSDIYPDLFLEPTAAQSANVAAVPATAALTRRAPIFRAETTAVMVPVTATSERGDFVPDLQPPDFRVFENDVEQRIDQVMDQATPFTVALLVDVSGSMRLEIQDIKWALLSFLETMRAGTEVLVATFDDRVLVHAGPTTDIHALVKAIAYIDRGVGSRLHDAVDLIVAERLEHLAGRKAIVLFTDGVDTRSRLRTAAQTLVRASEGQTAIHVLQYDTSEANRPIPVPSTLTPLLLPPSATGNGVAYTRATRDLVGLSDATGGLAYWVPTIAGVKNALARVATELNHQYTLAYYPSNTAKDGSYRDIRVEVVRPGIAVRARRGYRAPLRP